MDDYDRIQILMQGIKDALSLTGWSDATAHADATDRERDSTLWRVAEELHDTLRAM